MTTEAEALVALADLTDAFLSRHGSFPLDTVTEDQRRWRGAMEAAYAIVGQPGTSERARAMQEARAGHGGEPVAWQWRQRFVGIGAGTWSDWRWGRAPLPSDNGFVVEERQLYAHPPAPAKVRELVWRIFCSRSGNCSAETPMGDYVIQSEDDDWRLYLPNEEDHSSTHLLLEAALAAALPVIEAAILEKAAKVAAVSHMVPPDGGSPSVDECIVAARAASMIRALAKEAVR